MPLRPAVRNAPRVECRPRPRTPAIAFNHGNSGARVARSFHDLWKEHHMLSSSQIIAYVPVSDLPRARKFYEEKLGFRPVDTNQAGVMYESGKGSRFFVYR